MNNPDEFIFQGNPENFDVEKEVQKKINKMSFDPMKLTDVLVEIGQRMTGVTLYSYQIEPLYRIIYSLLVKDGAEITILYPRQSGKSEVIAVSTNIIAILFPVLSQIYPKELSHFKNGAFMGLFAPQGEQVDTVYQRCMNRLYSDPVRRFLEDPDIDDKPLSKVKFKLRSGSSLTGQSGAKQSRVESKTYHIIYLDEAQDLDTDKVRRSIMPMVASTFGTVVRTGTPGRYKGDFYYTIQNNKKHDTKLRTKKDKLTKKLHFEYTWKDVVKAKKEQANIDGLDFHNLYELSVRRDMKSWGDKSEAFRMAYRVEWLLDVGMFITELDFDEYLLDARMPIFDPKNLKNTDFIVAGLDIASAKNSTVLTWASVDNLAIEFGDRPRKKLCGWEELSGTNYSVQFDVLINLLLERRVRVLYCDYTGVGRALTDLLLHYLGDVIEIVPYTFTPSSKSDMWKSLDEDIRNGLWKVPATKKARETKEFENFKEQMLNLQKDWRGSYMVCQKTNGFMDDYCDSFGLCNLAGNHLYIPEQEVEQENNILFNNTRTNMAKRSRW